MYEQSVPEFRDTPSLRKHFTGASPTPMDSQPISRDRAVPVTSQELNRAIQELGERVTQLIERLEPVINLKTFQDLTPKATPAPHEQIDSACYLSNYLIQQVEHVQSLSKELEILVESLEI